LSPHFGFAPYKHTYTLILNATNISILTIKEWKYRTWTVSVIWWSEFLAADPEVPGSIPGATRFFCEVVGLERGPLSLVRIIEELLEWKSSGSDLENRV
jgi:hypothetical protein